VSSTPLPIADRVLTQQKELPLPSAALAFDISADQKKFYAACFDGVYELDAETAKRRQLYKHESYASGVRIIHATSEVISAGYDGALTWYSLTNGKTVRTVKAHNFWSWKMRLSPDQKLVASVTGQYKAGGYKYEPAPEREPSVRVYDALTGAEKASFPHVPSVQAVAFSPDSQHVAAGNIMGEVRIWNIASGKQVAGFTTPDFTCWGIIKNHHYVGGIFDMCFSPDGKHLLVCGMGPMVDPMAGNGKQTWQRFAWQENPARKIAQIDDKDAGAGLMEAIRFHPDQDAFVMAGRLNQGKWSTAIFSSTTGRMVTATDSRMRVTDSAWLQDGAVLALSGARQQERPKNGVCPDFGVIKLYKFA
jgi:WD40 repeat protein